ncbi:MAG TPA: MtrB/PioB family outer membrane beta-barrel protein [Rhizomicrobium sp.]|nr:MtrB/PioB family outer membrane beta-barrel protein [Rhizomicrobium sp.]
MLSAALPARADTGLLGGAWLGTETNPRGLIPDPPRDPNGLSLNSDVTRTPTGLLYPLPFAYPNMTQNKSDPDWWSYGWIDAGVLGTFGSDTHSAQFREYGDWNNGFDIASLGFVAENRKTAYYFSANAQDVGRDDQTYQLNAGRYGVFNLTLFFDATPHFLSTQAKSLWNGIGTDNLTLKDGLVPGASTTAQVNAVLAAAAPTDLKVERNKAGLAFNYQFDDGIEALLQLSNEWRDGTQAIGGTFGYPFQDGATQIVQPIHYTTLDMSGALRYCDDTTQANFTYSGSLFRNALQSLTWQNPGLSSIPGLSYIPPMGRLSLPPDNEYYSVKGDLASALTPQLRLSASATYSEMRQNEALIPPTVNTGVIPGLATAFDLNQWNTTAALSQQTAHAAINIFRAFAQLEYTPWSDVTLDLAFKDNNEDNRTNYVAFNPQTGQYGYIAIDGGLAPFDPRLSGIYEPNVPGSVVQIRNIPFANDNLEVDADAAYRISTHLKLDLDYTHNNIRHSDREVPDADDNRIKVQFVSNGNSWGTARASYEYAKLTGSDYTSNPYTPYYSQSLPGYIPRSPEGDPPFTLLDLRKFDVGNRTEHTLHAQTNFIVTPKIDFQITGDLKADGYEAQYGLRDTQGFDASAAFAYQLSLRTTFNAFYSFQFQNRAIANINPIGNSSPDGSAGGPQYPLADAWYEKDRDLDSTLGANLHQSFDTVTLDFNYTFTTTNSALTYAYASTGALFNSLTPEEAGVAFPNIDFRYHVLEANLRWQYSEKTAVRFYYRFDYQDIKDFHYTGLTPGVVSDNIYLGVVPENYTAQAFGAFIQYTF